MSSCSHVETPERWTAQSKHLSRITSIFIVPLPIVDAGALHRWEPTLCGSTHGPADEPVSLFMQDLDGDGLCSIAVAASRQVLRSLMTEFQLNGCRVQEWGEMRDPSRSANTGEVSPLCLSLIFPTSDPSVTSVEQLQAIGSVAAYALVKRAAGNPRLNLLWALEGALTVLPWQAVAREHRTSLLLALDEYERRV